MCCIHRLQLDWRPLHDLVYSMNLGIDDCEPDIDIGLIDLLGRFFVVKLHYSCKRDLWDL